MQLSELIAAVRDEVLDQQNLRWSDSTITRYLNDAQLDLAKVSRQLSMWQSSVDAGTDYTLLPPDLLIPKELWFEVGLRRYQLNMKHGFPPEPPSVRGYPVDAYIMGSYVYFYPVPQQSGTFYVLGVKRPTPMSAPTDTPELQDVDSLLITYAAWMCLLSDGNQSEASAKEALYNQMKAEWSVLDAQKNPLPNKIDRNWWW